MAKNVNELRFTILHNSKFIIGWMKGDSSLDSPE